MKSMIVPVLALMLSVISPEVAAADSLKQLCASYDKQEALLWRRLHEGARSWEKPRMQEQMRKVQAERARFCKGATSDSAS